VTSLCGEIYLLRRKERDQVEVYDVVSYRLQRRVTVPNAESLLLSDIASCEHYRCVYIGDPSLECVHRLDVQGAVTHWPVNDEPQGLSVNAAHNLIVTCREVGKIKEFSSRGELVRELTLPDDVINPRHVIQARSSSQFILCHGHVDVIRPMHRVLVMSSDGRHIVQSHGGPRGSEPGQYDTPARLAVDDDGFVFVADVLNCRVTLLSPTLQYVRHVVSRDQLNCEPYRLHLDKQRRYLYVVDNEWSVEQATFTAGRVVVFHV